MQECATTVTLYSKTNSTTKSTLPITKLPEELDVVAPKLNPEDAVLLLLAPDPNTNGGAAEPVLDVVAGLLS